VTAASAPRLTGGAIASVVLHGGLIAAFLVLRPAQRQIELPTYAVRLVAGPAATAATEVASTAATPPAPVAKPVAPAPTPPKKTVVAKKAKPTPAPAIPSQTARPKATQATTTTPPASNSATGGKGADVQNVTTGGVDFPYPYYTNGIVNEILKRFPQQVIRLIAEVRFVIRRDGSVDRATIQLQTSSGVYTFDMQAMGAVEAAANAKAFGKLPDGYKEDILPITFRFSPALVK
jgi:outer membrane biosynthesis protein TonB